MHYWVLCLILICSPLDSAFYNLVRAAMDVCQIVGLVLCLRRMWCSVSTLLPCQKLMLLASVAALEQLMCGRKMYAGVVEREKESYAEKGAELIPAHEAAGGDVK